MALKEARSKVKHLLYLLEITADGDLGLGRNSGGGEKCSDLGYVLEVEPTGLSCR